MIAAIITTKLHKSLKAGFHILYLLLVFVFISNTLLPVVAFTDYNKDVVEFTEKGDNEAKEEKKEQKEENETDDDIYQSHLPGFWYRLNYLQAEARYCHWLNPSIECFAPPPELA